MISVTEFKANQNYSIGTRHTVLHHGIVWDCFTLTLNHYTALLNVSSSNKVVFGILLVSKVLNFRLGPYIHEFWCRFAAIVWIRFLSLSTSGHGKARSSLNWSKWNTSITSFQMGVSNLNYTELIFGAYWLFKTNYFRGMTSQIVAMWNKK